MALLLIESFDHYATADRAKKGWSFSVAGASPGDTGCTIGAYGRNGTNGLRCRATNPTGLTSKATLTVSGVSGTTAVIGFSFKINTQLPATETLVTQIWNASAPQVSVTCSTGGALSVRRGGLSGTILSTSASTISHSTEYFVELKVLFDNAAGTYELRVNGVAYTSGTGADTIASGSAGWDSITFGNDAISFDHVHDHDDLYVCDGSSGSNNDFLGDHRIVCKVASSGNGTHTDWAPSTGSDHGALVDENPPDTADYNASATVGHRDTYNFAALGVVGTVKALQTVNLLRAEVAGVRTVAPTFRISGADYDGNGEVLGSDWSYATEVHTTNPATVAAWTVAEIDGAEPGAKVTA